MDNYKAAIIVKRFSGTEIPETLIEWFLLDWQDKLALFDNCGMIVSEKKYSLFDTDLDELRRNSPAGLESCYEELDGRLTEITVSLSILYRRSRSGWVEVYRELNDLYIDSEDCNSDKLGLKDCLKFAQDIYNHYKSDIPYKVISDKKIPVFSSFDGFKGYAVGIIDECDFGVPDKDVKECIYDFIYNFTSNNKWDVIGGSGNDKKAKTT